MTTTTDDAPIRASTLRTWFPTVAVLLGFVAQYVGLRGDLDALKTTVAAQSAKIESLTQALHQQETTLAVMKDRENRLGK